MTKESNIKPIVIFDDLKGKIYKRVVYSKYKPSPRIYDYMIKLNNKSHILTTKQLKKGSIWIDTLGNIRD